MTDRIGSAILFVTIAVACLVAFRLTALWIWRKSREDEASPTIRFLETVRRYAANEPAEATETMSRRP